MSVKQVSVYDGSSWVTEDIGANASNITLGSTIGGTTNLQTALTRFLPASTIAQNKMVVTNANGKLATSDTTVDQLSYLQGVTSNIQNQINTEKSTRASEDTRISNNFISQLHSEETTRQSEDIRITNELRSRISSEATARQNADNNLENTKANQQDLQTLSARVNNKANQQDLNNLIDILTTSTETVLWQETTPDELNGLNHNPITLNDNVTNYDYIDFYFDSEIKTIASNSTESTFRFINLSNTLRDSNNNIITALVTEEINIILSGTTARFNFQVQWYWQGKKDYDAKIYTFIDDNTTYSDPSSGQRTMVYLRKIVGRKNLSKLFS